MSNGKVTSVAKKGSRGPNKSHLQPPLIFATSTTLSPTNATILQQDSSHTTDVTPQQSNDSITPTETQESSPAPELANPSADTASTSTQPPKPVFSLFLTPEERKKKQEVESVPLTTTNTLNKRGKKPKSKNSFNTPTPTAATTSVKPPVDPKTVIDPNISKDGETHPFFQEVRASKLLAPGSTSTSSSTNTSEANGKSSSRRFNPKPQESPFPLSHQQFHGSETIDAINGVVARLCGLSATSELPSIMGPAKDKRTFKRSPESKSGWYNLRVSPDLGISAPQYKLRNRGKDSWTLWGKDRDQKWRNWSEKLQRLQRPNDKERQLLAKFADQPEEFDSCRRAAENQQLWQKNLEFAILTSVGLVPGTADVPLDIKIGELWTDKYRPNCGIDVLGNRPNTEYLTQWLKGLEISGWTLNSEDNSTNSSTGNPVIMKKTTDIMGTARKRRKRPKRGTSDMDDFVVYDDADDFEDPFGYMSEEEDELFGSFKPLSAFSRLAYSEPAIVRGSDSDSSNVPRRLPKTFDIKSNAILLSGPTGSCKTAAVYACAEECGYEVFEVSPGTRRTGKEVLGLVGEMAENHHVHVVPGKLEHKDELGGKSHETSVISTPPATEPVPPIVPASASKPTSTLHSFFAKTQYQNYRNQESEKDHSGEDVNMEDSSDIDIERDDEDQDGSCNNDTPGVGTPSSPTASSIKDEDKLSDLYSLLTTTNPRQSLILLEEIDILFDEDKGFWASIITLLSKSKRPVVMTCNDTSKIPAGTLRFQEHLEFERPRFFELFRYLTLICKIEGYMCSSEYIMALVKSNRRDVRRCLMQLQYESGVVRNKPQWSSSSSYISSESPASESQSSSPQGSGSPIRKKLQRLSRISVKGIVPVVAPLTSGEVKSGSSPLQVLEQLELQAQYAENISLWDSELKMKPKRAFQCFESDQFEANKDDIVGQHFSIYKRPSGEDHLLLDQECASLYQEGCESLYLHLTSQQGLVRPHTYEDDVTVDDPARAVAENFIPLNEQLSRNIQAMQPALEQTLSLQGLRFSLDATFETYAPLLRSMIHAENITTAVPTGKRTMRSGGHLRRHLNMLSDSERTLMISSSFPNSP